MQETKETRDLHLVKRDIIFAFYLNNKNMVIKTLLKLIILILTLKILKWWYRGFNMFIWVGCGITFSFARVSGNMDLLDKGWYKTFTEVLGFSLYMVLHVLWILAIRELIIKL